MLQPPRIEPSALHAEAANDAAALSASTGVDAAGNGSFEARAGPASERIARRADSAAEHGAPLASMARALSRASMLHTLRHALVDDNGRIAPRLGLPLLGLLLAAAIVLAGARGAFRIEPLQVLEALTWLPLASGLTDQQAAVLWSIRLPRVLLGALLGAGLAVSGAMLQGLFRNPLADPGLIGVTAGAALAAAGVIVLGATLAPGLSRALGLFTLPLAAFAGSCAALWIIRRLASREGITLLAMMLLAGIAVNAVAAAGIGLFTYMASDDQLRTLLFWSLGSLAPANWGVLAIVAPAVGVVLLLAMRLAPQLNALLLGEAEAGHLGIDVQRLKVRVGALSALAVGALTAFCGTVGFIGLVAPHCVRLALGPDHRALLPACALFGAALTVFADMVARTAFAPAELPLGILTALVGAPFFIALLLAQRRSFGV